jgi:biopolymer transport protein ExbB
MVLTETIWAVRDFVEMGGNVLLVIAFVTGLMWTLILERFWFFRTRFRIERQSTLREWNARPDHVSWNAHQIRRMLISKINMQLVQNLAIIKTLIAVCPMLGLLGTVTGMIEVFDVMASSGSGNARGMASGVSKATLPTMAGMVAALSGMIFSIQLTRYANSETQRVAGQLEIAHS